MQSFWLVTREGNRWEMGSEPMVIGSDDGCHVVIARTGIAPQHARLTRRGSSYEIEDLGSQDGTFIDGARLDKPTLLVDGATIRLGEKVFLRYAVREKPATKPTAGKKAKPVPPPEADITVTPASEPAEKVQEPEVEFVVIPDVVDSTASTPAGSETAIVVSAGSSVVRRTQEIIPRHGCSYCFRTVNPEDPDTALRDIIQVKGRYYHRQCRDKMPDAQQDTDVQLANIPVPPPLKTVLREGAPLHSGPLNHPERKPLGISEGTLPVRSTAPLPVDFYNNSEAPIKLSRSQGVPWAFADFGQYDQPPGDTITLEPGDSLRMTLYPHLVRPTFIEGDMHFTEEDWMRLESEGMPAYAFLVQAGTLLVLALHAWNTFWLLSYASRFPVPYILWSWLTLTLLLLLTAGIAPAWLTWRVYDALNGLEQRVKPLSGAIATGKQILFALFASGSITMITQGKPRALGIVAGFCAVVALVVTLVLIIVFSILGGIIGLVLWLAYLGVILFALYRFWLHYAFDVARFGVVNFRRLQRLLNAMSGSSKK
jgi:pSer/pThr/pTyr-binding forkhead associated (FHA) protein